MKCRAEIVEHGAVCIGETGGNLQERVKEHKYAVKRQDDNNGILQCQTLITWWIGQK